MPKNISLKMFFALVIIFLNISNSNAIVFEAMPSISSDSSGFPFDWDDVNGDHVVDRQEVTLPLALPTFSGIDFLSFGIHYSRLDNIATVNSFEFPFSKTSGFDVGPNGNGWYFSGGTLANGTPVGSGFISAGAFDFKIITPHFIGPFPDFRGFGTTNLTVTLPTLARKTVRTFFGNFTIVWFDSATFTWKIPYPIFTASFFKFTTEGDPTIQPDAVLTDVYAADLGGELGGPDGDIPLLTGFDPTNPQIVPQSGEQFVGKSGAVYSADFETVRLADLATRLPGYDLSRFTGDPDSIFYLAQATVPFDDVTTAAVPEPSTFWLLLIGGVAFMLLRPCQTRLTMDRQTGMDA